ncbi:Orc1-type DNA replication protein [Natrialba magadii ATCC 43099]|uniref:ORC1-type DNA replication protein n=1 Tax=Natrialba magadii (strain ATCC 43099 / DSM 3394 / CCM 3739 / CIP 104546 / IAM 13178 / JCM 8861 / NBRC 102185 / NCIMB 2190 / MS3) TaxID=547559 RepID=D3SV93_NATMM|nr:ORC1-type DNA replication protein [Natrialba magadii]ADD05501.1 Orc1-type DNA replication protein [Natrialba magadii ATCC 43099]ELY29536.1 orc1/cdc6 family replication initiation protein [Natrialba magadii ATCC 43099]
MSDDETEQTNSNTGTDTDSHSSQRGDRASSDRSSHQSDLSSDANSNSNSNSDSTSNRPVNSSANADGPRNSTSTSPSTSTNSNTAGSDNTHGFSTDFGDTDLGDDGEDSNQGLFDDLLSGEPIFENKEVLRPSYTPHELPHRSDQINKMATILVAALRGETPSNILIYGKTGTGKTASAKFVSKELESTSQKYSVPCDVEYINCEVTDTQYRVLAQLANKFIEKNKARIDDQIESLQALREEVAAYDEASERQGSTDTPSATQSESEHNSNISTGNDPDQMASEEGNSSHTPVENGGYSNSSGASERRERSENAQQSHGTPPRQTANQPPHPLEETAFESVADIDARIESLREDKDSFEEVPMTGWPTDRVYSVFFDAVDYDERVVVIMLDEIDKLVEKSGDDTLYNLSRMNSELENSRVSIIGISNDLKFTDFLDPRVKSSLGEEEIVFPPYDANQLRDILQHRSEVAFKGGALSTDVIPLCAAFAAQEHGDARRALDLLRTAGELAERSQAETIVEEHVRQAQDKIELDRVVEVVRTLPTQSKLVLFAIILLEKNGVHSINTGEVFNIYKRLCEEIDADVLTQRRVTDLISELDMLGIVNAVVVSKGRYGRTKEISLSVPIDETEAVLLSDSRLSDIDDIQPFVQARFEN